VHQLAQLIPVPKRAGRLSGGILRMSSTLVRSSLWRTYPGAPADARGSGAAPSADDGVIVKGPRDDARMSYAARVLPFADRATFAFLADLIAVNPVSVGAAVAALLAELSIDVVRISR
jgi:hypothetical protein